MGYQGTVQTISWNGTGQRHFHSISSINLIDHTIIAHRQFVGLICFGPLLPYRRKNEKRLQLFCQGKNAAVTGNVEFILFYSASLLMGFYGGIPNGKFRSQ